MDDEIDIEEHDVFDNPLIRSIFPDITALKKEITYEFEDEPDINEDVDTRSLQFLETEDHQSEGVSNSETCDFIIDVDNYISQNEEDKPKLSNIIIIGSKPMATNPSLISNVQEKILLGSKFDLNLEGGHKKSACEMGLKNSSQDNIGQKLHGSSPVVIQDEIKKQHIVSKAIVVSQNYDGLILLGSNPKHSQDDDELGTETKIHNDKSTTKHIKIILKDIKSYLNKNSRYCKICCRLFLSKNALEVHNNKTHPKNNDKKIYFPKKVDKVTHKCICGSNFSSKNNLYRHYKNIHADKIKALMKSQVLSSKKCSICNIRFKTLIGLTIHNISKHEAKSLEKKVRNSGIFAKEHDQTTKVNITLSPKKRRKNSRKIESNMASTSEKIQDDSTATAKRKRASANKTKLPHKGSNMASTSEDIQGDSIPTTKRKLDSAKKTKLSHNESNMAKTFEKVQDDSTATAKRKRDSKKKTKLPHNVSNMASTSEKMQDESIPTAKRKRAFANKSNDLTSLSRITASDRKERLIAEAKHESKADKVFPKNNGNINMNDNKNHESKYVTRANSIHKTSNLCLHCNKQFPDQKSLTEHMYQIIEPKRSSSGSAEKVDTVIKPQDDKILFACRHCSYYLLGITNYFTHIIKNHKIEKFLQINKEKFDPQCKFCSFKCSSISAHNNHIYQNHNNLMYVKIEDEIEYDKNIQLKKSSDHFYEDAFSDYKEFALESVLFECNKCSTCFLSSDIAMDHEQHKELLINWKCTICSLILKEQDKVMHLKQHSFSESIKMVTLNETANVLYICTKCAIHFTDNKYQRHYPICGLKITDSFRCGKCDILVDKTEKYVHETQHVKFGNTLDFTIIDSNVITNDNDASLESMGTTSEPRHIKRTVENNCLTYCPTCKVFLKDLGLKNKNHIKGTCSQVLKYICDECGLVFTSSVLTLHKEHHKREKSLKLQDFKFFDLQGKQGHPPVPEYPHCKRCGVHFLTKQSVYIKHKCDETDFFTCDICNIKLIEKAYMLHMSFHFYVIQTTRQESENVPLTPKEHTTTATKPNICENEGSELKLGKTTNLKLHSSKAQIKESTPNTIEPSTEITSREDSFVVLYTCKPCGISFESYDEVIKHCQTHYSKEDKKISSVKKCNQCLLNFDSQSYICHEQRIHLGASKIQILKFDPRYYTSKNKTWVKHIFESLTEEAVAELLLKSIYQHEHRIPLECIQRGSSNVYVYKCDKCKNFIDQAGIYKHAQNSCDIGRKYPCTFCGINYRSWLSRSNHEDLHRHDKTVTKRSLNIVLFNQKKDTLYNGRVFSSRNQNIFYQCRNCSGVTEKSIPTNHKCDTDSLVKCKTCGLLIWNVDYKAHMAQHIHTKSFCAENFKVILFGSSNVKGLTKKLSSSFIGTVYDYSVLKCKKCEMCLRNTEYAEKHVCSNTNDLDRLLCHDCNLYFPSSYFKLHVKRHQTDPDYIIENINVIEFLDGKIEQKRDVDQIIMKENETITVVDDVADNFGALKSLRDNVDENPINDKILYKCKCGLHFVNKQKVAEHVNACQKKQTKQNCSKCNLLFNANELFSHLILHHKDKSQVCNFRVIELTENVVS